VPRTGWYGGCVTTSVVSLRVVALLPERAVRLSNGFGTTAPREFATNVRPATATRGLTSIAKIAFVSTYPPQRCGIATFTADLAGAVGDGNIVALEPSDKTGFYPREVRRRVARDIPADYLSAARWIDAASFDVVSVQHEYGIWGGRDGSYVLDFIGALRTPVVSTLHTVLQNPSASQRSILTELVRSSAATVVMSNSAAELLALSYGTDKAEVDIVPHGVPYIPLTPSSAAKAQLGLSGRMVVLSFGLLGPGKGYESAIAAMPAVVEADPTAVYVIVGATHPELIRREGEAYRAKLVALASDRGVGNHVRFVGRYVDSAELSKWLTAADIFVTPYPNLEQIVSGTLSYAMGAGKAIVSTPYAYAAECLAEGRGRLVAAGSTEDLARGIVELALNSDLRASHGKRAYEYSRGMLWPEVGASYRKIFARVARASAHSEHVGVAARTIAVAGV
jgi:glycosyltransferase involved in cell wall biosynthesis